MAVNIPDNRARLDYIERVRAWRCELEQKGMNSLNTDFIGFPLNEILELFHVNGKHFANPLLLDELSAIQSLLTQDKEGTETSFDCQLITALLRVLLDKHTNTYHYLTYTALPIFELYQHFGHEQFDKCLNDQLKLVVAIVCDLIRFELNTLLGLESRFQLDVLSVQILKQRIYLCIRAVKSFGSYVEPVILPNHIDDLIELWRQESLTAKPLSKQVALQSMTFTETILEQFPENMNLLLDLTMFPVHVSHDEYMFIRMLQAFEMVFTIMAEGLELCIDDVSSHQYQQAANTMTLIDEVFRLSPSLFRVLNTMTSEHFSKFRDLTEGSSAIQSIQFKRIEVYSAHPDKQRFRSPAFQSVPPVQREYEQSSFKNLQDLIAPLLKEEENGREESFHNLIESMHALDDLFVNWKKIHYRIAKNMIGDAKGTGNTSGPPYLKFYLEQRLFPFLHPALELQH